MATNVEATKDTVVILGATGGTGLHLVQQALARGYQVSALVRNAKKLEHIKHENLKVVECDLMNSADLATHMAGACAVLSALGQPGLTMSPISFYQNSIASIVPAMRIAKIKRLICMTSMYTKYQPEKYPFSFRLIIRPMIGRHLDSMFIMEEYLEKEAQDLDFTVVRPPRLTDDAIIERGVQVCENDYFFPSKSTPMRMPRANCARFMLDLLKSNQYVRQGIAIDMQ